MVKRRADLDGVFGALADPVRRHIVEQLAHSVMTAGELAAGVAISQPAVSRHIKILESCGLIERTVIGREHHLRLAPNAMKAATRWLDRQSAFWNASFDKLDTLLETTSRSKSPK